MKFLNGVLISLSLVATIAQADLSASDIADSYQWLRDDARSSEKVMRYLEQQNLNTRKHLKSVEPIQNALSRQWRESSPDRAEQPWLIRAGFEYQIEYVDEQRWLSKRARGTTQATRLLNIEQRAKTNTYYELGNWSLSPSGRYVALAEDVIGSELYQISVIDLQTQQEWLLDQRNDTALVWGADNESVYGVLKQNQDGRPSAVIQYQFKTSTATQIYQENDKAWLVSAYQTNDNRYALVQSNDESSSEQRLLNLATGEVSEPLRPRQVGVEYYADVADNTLYINSNLNGQFELFQQDLNAKQWQLLYSPDGLANLENFYLFEAGIALVESHNGQKELVVVGAQGKEKFRQSLSSAGSVGWVSRVGDYTSNVVRIRSMSLIQPAKWQEFDLSTLEMSTLSQDRYPSYQASEYQTEQIWVESNGVQVPVTLAYKPSLLKQSSPVILYGYGAYGFAMKPYFMPQIVSLLDHGIIYAIAHVRGGGYFGEQWHHDGRGINKAQGVMDFVQAVKAMKAFKGGERKVAAIGSSAGGTLVAAAVNQDPTLFTAVSLNVPFVDVVASMSDETLPLTAQQYQEWGNPNVATELKIMSGYDPITNIKRSVYPASLIRIGWQDRRVPYWEGAKYHAMLNELTQGTSPQLLSTDFESGHATDRRKASQRQAMDYAFLIQQLQSSD